MEVYNLTTNCGTFIADGFVTHNCGNVHTQPVVYRSIENIVAELKELKYRGVNHFRFEDDCFTIIPDFDLLCDELKELDIRYKCHTRSNLITKYKAKWMFDSGCEECGLGVESADPVVLQAVNKKCTVEQHREAVKIIKDSGMRAKAYFVMGMPGETDMTLELNKKFVRETQLDKWTISTFMPYPGCPIFRSPGKFKVEIIDKDFSHWWNYANDFSHTLLGQTREQMYERYRKFYDYMKSEEWKR